MAVLSLKILAAPDTPMKLIEPLRAEISHWLASAPPKTTAAFARLIDITEGQNQDDEALALDWLNDDFLSEIAAEQASLDHCQLGIAFSVKKPFHLKDPLNFLFGLAKRHRCEFAVVLDNHGEQDEVCFFGYEEGRPDMYEIAQYLGLS